MGRRHSGASVRGFTAIFRPQSLLLKLSGGILSARHQREGVVEHCYVSSNSGCHLKTSNHSAIWVIFSNASLTLSESAFASEGRGSAGGFRTCSQVHNWRRRTEVPADFAAETGPGNQSSRVLPGQGACPTSGVIGSVAAQPCSPTPAEMSA